MIIDCELTRLTLRFPPLRTPAGVEAGERLRRVQRTVKRNMFGESFALPDPARFL
jgi:hypothetical protein